MEFQYFFTLFTLGLFKQLFQALASIPVTPENFLKQSWFNLDQSSWTKSETPWEPPPTRWTLNPWPSESLRTLDLLLLKLLKKNWLKDPHQPLLLLLSQRHLVACPAFLETAKILSKLNLLISTTTMNSMLLRLVANNFAPLFSAFEIKNYFKVSFLKFFIQFPRN